MVIEFNRNSICMADDMMSHRTIHKFSDTATVLTLLEYLADYVPRMNTAVWAIISDNYDKKVIGFIFTDEEWTNKVELNTENILLKNLFCDKPLNLSVYCKNYYIYNTFWDDGIRHVKHYDYPSLFKKIKKDYGG